MKTICENCSNYVYDDELESYCCDAMLDEDEMYHFLKGDNKSCPYFHFYDEYSIVRKQN